MNPDLIELAVERGRLIERISQQRRQLGQQLQPLGAGLHGLDQAIAVVRRGSDYAKQHPEMVAAGVAVFVVLQPRRVWRWSKRGFFLWRAWRKLRQQVSDLGLPRRP